MNACIKKTAANQFACLIFCFCCISSFAAQNSAHKTVAEQNSSASSSQLTFAQVEELGRKLRQDLDQTYLKQNLSKNSILENSPILEKVVRQYIKPGDGFGYAQVLLKAAGMGVTTDPTHVPSREGVKYGFLLAQMEFQTFFWGGHTGVGIMLYPKKENYLDFIDSIKVNYYRFP